MPTKTTKTGREYDVDGKQLIWYPLDDNDEPGNLPEVVIPLRLKIGAIRDIAERELDVAGMFTVLGRLMPDSVDALDEMDVNDFQEMFATWQDEYAALSGAGLGEASGSSS